MDAELYKVAVQDRYAKRVLACLRAGDPYGCPGEEETAPVRPKHRNERPIPSSESITQDTPLRLNIAARLAFPPDTGVTQNTLRNEIRRGRLPRREFGGKLWLTLN